MEDIVFALIMAKAIGGGTPRALFEGLFDQAAFEEGYTYDNTATTAET